MDQTSNIFANLLSMDGGIEDLNTGGAASLRGSAPAPTGVVEKKPPRGNSASAKLLDRIEELGYDMDSLDGILKTKGSQLVIAGAGAGKTTALLIKLMYDVATNELTKRITSNGMDVRIMENVMVCTFLSSGAKELETRYKEWQSKVRVFDASRAFNFTTLHAEFLSALKSIGLKIDIIDGKENTKFLREAAANLGITGRVGKLTNEEVRSLEGALSYTRNRMDERRYINTTYDELEITPARLDLLLIDWKERRRIFSKFDFEDLQETMYELLYERNNPDVIAKIQARYGYIYIDEFQDTSQIQYAILKKYAEGAKKIIAIGDDDQTIYTWRGSDSNIITKDFMQDFNPSLQKIVVNYRCPSNILNPIIPSIEMNQNRYEKVLKSANEGGELRIGAFDSYTLMSQNLERLVYEDIQEGRSVAILCRVNADGLVPALMLDRGQRVRYAISGDGMTLNSYMGRLTTGIARLFTDKTGSSIEQVLGTLTGSRNQMEVRRFLSGTTPRDVNLWNIDLESVAYSCPNMYPHIMALQQIRGTAMEEGGGGERVALMNVYRYFWKSVFNGGSGFHAKVRETINSLMILLQTLDVENVDDFLEEVRDVGRRLTARIGKKNVKIRISTVHDFKGKEADSVYVWNASEGVFPSNQLDTNSVSYEDEYEEERRIFYIACTRAKQISTILHRRGEAGDFIKEMDLSGATVISNDLSVRLGASGSDGEE